MRKFIQASNDPAGFAGCLFFDASVSVRCCLLIVSRFMSNLVVLIDKERHAKRKLWRDVTFVTINVEKFKNLVKIWSMPRPLL